MEFVQENWMMIALAIMASASVIASATPNKKDDAIVAKIVNLLGFNFDRVINKDK